MEKKNRKIVLATNKSYCNIHKNTTVSVAHFGPQFLSSQFDPMDYIH